MGARLSVARSISPTKVGVIGSVGAPARYGGFETLAEQLARVLPSTTVELTIYCERSAYTDGERAEPHFCGHRRVFVPLKANGPSSIPYDIASIVHAVLVAKVDVLLVLGCSGAAALAAVRALRPSVRIVTNIDGMEWRREKWSGAARRVLRLLERLAASYSHSIVADNVEIARLAMKQYGVASTVIPYGGDHTLVREHEGALPESLPQPGYFLSVARIEPENNCELILEAFYGSNERIVYIGNWEATKYGRKLRSRFGGEPNMVLLSPVYDIGRLAWYRSRARGYLHGHSVGGTNPSLVEALFWSPTIAAFDCPFNKATLNGCGVYFGTSAALRDLLAQVEKWRIPETTLEKLKETYAWQTIGSMYSSVLRQA